MPSEMHERGRRDAEADALDENYYHYYYDYKVAFDEVTRKRRRSRRQRALRQVGRWSILLIPLLLIIGGVAYAGYRYVNPAEEAAAALTPTPTRTPRPTLVPPTPEPEVTAPPEIVLRTDGFAIITGTQGAALRARETPGTDKDDIVARFQEGETVRVVEGPAEANGMTWWRIEGEGRAGWASATYLAAVPPPQ